MWYRKIVYICKKEIKQEGFNTVITYKYLFLRYTEIQAIMLSLYIKSRGRTINLVFPAAKISINLSSLHKVKLKGSSSLENLLDRRQI